MGDKQQAQSRGKYGKTGSYSLPTRQTSMCSLIIWNISKALENNPCMDLRHAMRSAHERLGHESRDMISQPAEERHLTCAILAWHQLGHKDTDSLYQFIEQNRNKPVRSASENYSNKENIDSVNKASVSSTSENVGCNKPSVFSKETDSFNSRTNSLMGPVVKLPMETKIVMRLDNITRHDCSRHSAKKPPKTQNDIMSKIDAACCMDKICVQRLTELDTAVSELRSRAAKLARRETERVELLERAESAWKDLELGYQRRLNLALEKEEDLAKQIEKTIEERNNYKNACINLADHLKERSELAEKERDRLTSVEKTVCDRAAVRMRLSEDAARGDADLADQLCRSNQMDIDLRFKEDQARRKATALEGEVESVQCLTHEAERSMRAELGVLKEQVTNVANQLLAEESKGNTTKIEVEELRKERDDILEDLNGCKEMCDNNMQGKINTLKKKREELIQLKNKVIECRCKLPLDAAVEVKRSPSLAALCNCAPEDKFLESCSCTSLRSQLLSNLLADLFGGLQSELNSGTLMPCQLLKCLEDKHNWDRSSILKTNLKDLFEQLLVGELDIAIATSIEKYHAKWVGASCADAARMSPDPGDVDEGWQNRAIERRAQKLATQLAEKLLKERVEEINKKAKEIVTKGPPPCKCETQHPAVYPCLVKRPITPYSARITTDPPPPYLKRTLQDVTQLRVQIEDLKKEIIKKEDLRLMEEKIARTVKRASKPNNIAMTAKKIKNVNENDEIIKKIEKSNTNEKNRSTENIYRKKVSCSTKKGGIQSSYDKFGRIVKRNTKLFKKIEQSFAVNLCLCGTQDNYAQDFVQHEQKQTNNVVGNIPSYKKNKLLNSRGNTVSQICPSRCVCFHKIPSNTSIDKLLETLVKWKRDLKSSIICDGKQEKQLSDSKLAANADNIIKRKDYVLDSIKAEKIPLLGKKSSTKYSDNVMEFYSTKEDYDKGTDYDQNIPAIGSEYIGEINLDKSNDNSCKCANYNQNKLKSGDNRDMTFTCINTKMCDCKKMSELNLNINQYSSKVNKSDMKKMSQEYSMKLQDPHLKINDDTQLCKNTSQHSFENSRNSFVENVLKQSNLLARDCDYRIKLLGVTIANAYKATCNKDIETNMRATTVSQILTKSCEVERSDQKSDSEIHGIHSFNNNKIERVISIIGEPYERKEISETLDNEEEQKKCICCDTNDTEESKEMELNAFNLLEEHLKGKLAEFQRSFCKSKCISAEEEKILFSTILKKAKQIISEDTNQIICDCIGINEESWTRAYGLIQEYLKIKISKVECSCISNKNSFHKVLPVIMDKLTNLIEKDFQLLRDKCKCENKIINSNNTFKKLREQMTENILKYNDVYVQLNDSANNEDIAKLMEDTSIQVSSISFDNKSCEATVSDVYNKNTAEKKISCEFGKGYITDCNCRQKQEYTHFENYVIANPCVECESMLSKNAEKEKSRFDTSFALAQNKVTNNYFPKKHSSISEINKLELLQLLPKTKSKIKFPYFGYTLNCTCDRSLGVCYCNKSVSETYRKEIDSMWKSFKHDSIFKNVSYIMPKIPTKVKSECLSINTVTDSTYLNCCTQQQDSIKSLHDVEIITSDNEEEFVLKRKSEHSKENINLSKNFISIATECFTEDSSIFIEHFETISKSSNKKALLDSLYLPNNHIIFDSPKNEINRNDRTIEPKLDCNCEKVPICHVKMLVDEIENKLVA